MPGLYGTELMDRARAGGYTGDFIVLSGYSDFQYAQSAMRSGAVCYLTKPIDEDELAETLKKIRARLDASAVQQQTYDTYREKARQAALGDLLMGKPATEDLAFAPDGCQLLLCRAYTPGEGYAEVARWLGGSVGRKYPFEELSLGETEVFLLEWQGAIEHFARICADGLDGVLDGMVLACGPVIHRPEELHAAFGQTYRLLKRTFFCGSGQHILTLRDLPAPEALTPPPAPGEAAQTSERLAAHLQAFQRRALTAELDTLRCRLENCAAEPAELRHFLADVFLQLKAYLCGAYPSATLPFASQTAILRHIETSRCLEEILRYFASQLEQVLQALGGNSGESILDDVLFYIDHNYAQPLKLEGIARLFGYNSSYLGRIFTQRTGKSFNTYLDEVRVAAARELL